MQNSESHEIYTFLFHLPPFIVVIYIDFVSPSNYRIFVYYKTFAIYAKHLFIQKYFLNNQNQIYFITILKHLQ